MDIVPLFHCCPPCVQQLWVADPPGGHCFGSNLQVRPSSFTEQACVCSGIPGFPVNLCSGRHWCTHHCAPCLSDNLHRATGQCLRDIWPQQQRQRSTGRLFSRSVTTERRFRWSLRAACSRSPSRLQPSVASRGWPGEHQHQSPLGAPPCEPCNGQSVTNK